ncbi:GNAT family N-acetyltransferase [Levilactobacillus bambusae]|uniref:GNAT family N-acetyltransferase n=1 Tax=Levilactobacillus bambusae TaxID=2024736 RepID=UPI001CDB1F23|nr:GNAT family N-acetyltransferase [Levilactobacillus bambusae]
MTLQFQIATLADLPDIVAIYNESIPNHHITADLAPVTVSDRQSWFDAHSPAKYPLWVIYSGPQLVGWLSLSPYSDRAGYRQTSEISLYLTLTAQGHHFGRQSLQFALEQAPQFGFTVLISRVFGSNHASRHLFETGGFDHWGHLPRIANQAGAWEDLEVYGIQLH